MEIIILTLIIVLIIVTLLYIAFGKDLIFINKDTFTDTSIKKSPEGKEVPVRMDIKKIMIYPPSDPHNIIVTDNFKYKTWDGTNWECQIVNGEFYVRQMGSQKIYPVRVINVLRFRSQQWQVAYLKPLAKFLVYRFGGTIGMPYEKLNLVDWNDQNYTIKVIP